MPIPSGRTIAVESLAELIGGLRQGAETRARERKEILNWQVQMEQRRMMQESFEWQKEQAVQRQATEKERHTEAMAERKLVGEERRAERKAGQEFREREMKIREAEAREKFGYEPGGKPAAEEKPAPGAPTRFSEAEGKRRFLTFRRTLAEAAGQKGAQLNEVMMQAAAEWEGAPRRVRQVMAQEARVPLEAKDLPSLAFRPSPEARAAGQERIADPRMLERIEERGTRPGATFLEKAALLGVTPYLAGRDIGKFAGESIYGQETFPTWMETAAGITPSGRGLSEDVQRRLGITPTKSSAPAGSAAARVAAAQEPTRALTPPAIIQAAARKAAPKATPSRRAVAGGLTSDKIEALLRRLDNLASVGAITEEQYGEAYDEMRVKGDVPSILKGR